MYKICKDCGKKCDLSEKKCPVCGGKLKKQFTEEELKEIQKQNDDMAVINTLLMQIRFGWIGRYESKEKESLTDFHNIAYTRSGCCGYVSVYPIRLSDEYLELDILAHEITHAELRTRLSAEAQKRIPTWFDEGIALQNDYREKYSEAQWITQTDNGKNAVALEDMDTPAEFYAGKAEDRRFRYLNAKHELDVWMTTHGQHGLLELLDRLNGGADFTTAYEG